MARDSYKYQIIPLPEPSIPGSDAFGNSQYGGDFRPSGQAVLFPTTTPITAPGGGGGGGGGTFSPPTVDLELCTGDIARVYGYIIPP